MRAANCVSPDGLVTTMGRLLTKESPSSSAELGGERTVTRLARGDHSFARGQHQADAAIGWCVQECHRLTSMCGRPLCHLRRPLMHPFDDLSHEGRARRRFRSRRRLQRTIYAAG
jgi:hypothetical protein